MRDRIQQGISLRRPLPNEVTVDEQHLAVTLRVERSDAAQETERFEGDEVDDALPRLHELWDLTKLEIPPVHGVGGRAFANARRGALRLLGPLLRQQSAYNGANARAMSVALNRSTRQQEDIEAIAKHALDAISVSLRRHTEALLELERTISRLEREVTRLTPLSVELDEVAFAERFRGTEEEVKARLKPLVGRIGSEGGIVDLAAGRGELLELLREAGVPSRGLETSGRLVDHCRAKTLDVQRREPLAFLEEAEPASLGGIVAFGLVTRLEPGSLVTLVQLAARALKPGGILLLDLSEPWSLASMHRYDTETVSWLLGQEQFNELQVDAGAITGRRA
jgi:Methionine biosynthesis protein MetW